jgi:hypothetical protein
VVGAIAAEVSKLVTFMLIIFFNSLFGRHFFIKGEDLLNDFSELYQNFTLIKTLRN